MNVQTLVKKCLDQQHYGSGIAALKMANVNYPAYLDSVLKQFHVSETDFKRLRLHVLPLVDSVEQEKLEVAETKANAPVKAVEPDPVRILRVQGARAYDVYEGLKTQLCIVTTDAERYEVAEKIMDITARIDDIYARIREWEQTGEIPFVMNDAAQQAVKMMKRMDTLKPQISRLRKKTSEADQKELSDKLQELQEIKNKLKPILN